MTTEPEITIETEAEAATLAVYDAARAKLAELQTLYSDFAADVTTTNGMKAAIVARADLRTTRKQVESDRADVKRPYLEACRLIDAEAKRITTGITVMESPIDADIKAEQARRRKIKEAAEKAEQERLAALERDRLAAEQAELDEQAAALKAAQKKFAAERKEAAEQDRQREAARVEEQRKADEAAVAKRAKLDAAAAAERKRLSDVEEERQEKERERIAKRTAELKVEADRQARERELAEAAERAERDRLAKIEEGKRMAHEQAEQDARDKAEALEIEHATLLTAAAEVVACFAEWDVGLTLPARKLAAAVARETQ